MSSTLVETVSIDYEDFNESFLTCGTCLCMYDGSEHIPKLMPCSHTVCLHCLDRIVATFARDTGQFRCPICRELITIPRGGVCNLPPSFLVNQLLGLVARQRRDVIPKCSTHHNQELLFCETCDTVFCSICTGGTHKPPGGDTVDGGTTSLNGSPSHTAVSSVTTVADHTVIPFSVAIKRMSEILIYKANECTAKLDEASEIVKDEIHRLDHNADDAFEKINVQFQAILDGVERARQAVLNEAKRSKDEKRKVLDEQLNIIQSEKTKVASEVKSMQNQVEVRNITKKISDLNCKLDTVSTLSEPRENSYIEYVLGSSPNQRCEADPSEVLNEIDLTLRGMGRIKTSKTFPSLCRASMDTAIACLETVAKVTTIDYNGSVQEHGGDPVEAQVIDDKGGQVDVQVNDRDDGTYEVRFTAMRPGTYCLKVMIFDRPIKDCPLFFDVSEHNAPVISFGVRGAKDKGFNQPCSVAVARRQSNSNEVFVVDTGNSRIKRLTCNLDFVGHISNEGLEGRSVTGVCMGSSDDSLLVINWRSKTVTEISLEGHTIGSFTHDDLKEPIDLAIDADGQVLVADNGVGSVLVFESSGKLLRTIGDPALGGPKTGGGGGGKAGGAKGGAGGQPKPGHFRDISAVAVAPTGQVVVADGSRIQVFTSSGELVREIWPPGKTKGRYGGLVCDDNGFLLATRTEKAKSFIQVFRLEDGSLYSVVDSHGSKMKRPTGLSVTNDRHLVVVDIDLACVRKYRYF